jgi:hypothetical protein
MATNFTTALNQLATTVGTGGYTAGSGTLPLATGYGAAILAEIAAEGAPAVSSTHPIRVSVIVAAHSNDSPIPATYRTIFRATGLSGDVLSGITAIEGTTDRNFVALDVVRLNLTAGSITEVQVAGNAAEATIVTNTSSIATNAATVTAHIANVSNPHAVTKTQVGLALVDNTTDLNKPISTATSTALAGKQAGPLTGDVTTSGAAATLATVNATVGSFTAANVTVDAKGRVTAAASGSATVASGTSGRIPYETTGGALTDTADLAWDQADTLLKVADSAGGRCYVGLLAGQPSVGAIWFGTQAPDAANYAFLSGFGTTALNSTAELDLRIANSTLAAFVAGHLSLGPFANIQTYHANAAVSVFSGSTGVSPLSVKGLASQSAPLIPLTGVSSTSTDREVGYVDGGFTVSTDASYRGFVRLCAQDFNAPAGGREGLRVGTSGTAATLGFYGVTPVVKAATPTTLADVILLLQNLGLCN